MIRSRRSRRTLLAPVLLVLVAALLAGCGSDDDAKTTDDAGSAKTTATTTAEGGGTEAGTEAEAALKIRVTEVGNKESSGIPMPRDLACTRSIPATCTGTVECPAAEDAPADRRDLCVWLAGPGLEALQATAGEKEACTMQFGGPEVATITGTVGDEKIDATFTRENGCDIARFDAVSPLWNGVAPEVPGSDATSSCPATSSPDAPVSSDAAPAAGAADGACSTPPSSGAGTPPSSPPAAPPSAPSTAPETMTDPPEAFEK